MTGLSGPEKSLIISLAVSTQYVHESDGRTDGHRPTASTVLMRTASLGKKTDY